MKKFLYAFLLTALAVCMAVVISACTPNYKEVAGTYEMVSISGEVNNITVSTDSYEYYTMILEANGKATVKSKAKGGVSYEAHAKFSYKDGKIKLVTTNGSASVTEEMEYADGVITYIVDTEAIKLNIVLERATGNQTE